MVTVEDHLYHTAELLDAIARRSPDLLAWTTCCAIDDPGRDTTAAVAEWIERYPSVRIAAVIDTAELPAAARGRVVAIDPKRLAELGSFARLVASLLRPGGILLQDVHLSTLRFIPADRWWESIYLAATVRGTFAQQPPAVRFLSNKRGYAATFGRDLMDAGFDPRDVLDKAELDDVVVPSLLRELDRRFPLELVTSATAPPVPIPPDDAGRREVEAEIDVVLWDVGGRLELGGRSVVAPVTFRSASQEARTWRQLIDDRVAGGTGLPISEVGARLSEPGAERAEISNLAARHVHALRARLVSGQAIVTAHHAYRLDPGLAVGVVRARESSNLR